MADAVLLLRWDLGQGPPVDLEDGVVSEAALASRLGDDAPLQHSPGRFHFPLRRDEGDDGSKASRAIGHSLQLRQHLGDVLGV